MNRLQRIALITVGLAVSGAATGAVSATVGVAIVVALFFRVALPVELLIPAATIGAAFGALVAPTLSWIALRHVSLARAVLAIAIGSGVGGAVGVAVGASSVNPYVALSLMRAPVPQGALGALLGAILMALVVARIERTAPASERAA